YQLTGQVAQIGFLPILQFLGILSINLAVVNILPIPELDGGRLLFIVIEAVARKRVKTDIEAYIHQFGMILLISLIILVTIGDVRRIFGDSIASLFNSLWMK
ncbi:MAG: site-2 protease family protein, partial [bacterium]|nr:site-2 protease family protein [bacterium]